jgi:hypothetical protein
MTKNMASGNHILDRRLKLGYNETLTCICVVDLRGFGIKCNKIRST